MQDLNNYIDSLFLLRHGVGPKRKYKSDLEVFIRESKLEDFFDHVYWVKEGAEREIKIILSELHFEKIPN